MNATKNTFVRGMGEWWYFTNHHVCTLKKMLCHYAAMPSQKKHLTWPHLTVTKLASLRLVTSLFSVTLPGFPLIPQYVGTAQSVWAEYRVHSISYLSSSGSSSMNWPLNMALQMSSDTFFIVFSTTQQVPHLGGAAWQKTGHVDLLVGGWTNPFEKYESNWESSPIFGVNIKIFESTNQQSILGSFWTYSPSDCFESWYQLGTLL